MISLKTLSNGLTVIVEEIPHVESVAYELLIPGGIIADEESRVGASLILAELTSRGAGGMSSRELSDSFDERGIRHSEHAGHDRFGYHGSLLAEELPEALRLVSLMVREPGLPEAEVGNIRSILMQDIASLMDNPARRVMVELARRYYPHPYSRSSQGEAEGLKHTNREHLTSEYKRTKAKKSIRNGTSRL